MRHKECMYNPKDIMNKFYLKLEELKVFNISNKQIIKLLSCAYKNKLDVENMYNLSRLEKYLKIIERLMTCPKKLNAETTEEVYLMFMFIIDPDFKAAIIHGSYNMTKDIKFEMEKEFGIYDPNLIKIEQFYIKNILSSKKRQKIEEEIEERVFKL